MAKTHNHRMWETTRLITDDRMMHVHSFGKNSNEHETNCKLGQSKSYRYQAGSVAQTRQFGWKSDNPFLTSSVVEGSSTHRKLKDGEEQYAERGWNDFGHKTTNFDSAIKQYPGLSKTLKEPSFAKTLKNPRVDKSFQKDKYVVQ
ncbi:unnamed protein product [Phytophthora lilii]|uniref:Unnamed protein product n=1 Tax=Phytophthora lilii TaxID=2077276 RepID=A0A9W6UB87_9STRA|nr:unnamed protein product [Phytophthora lilii]